MISTGFLIFTLVLVAIGAFWGFLRGIKKEGIRFGLWIVTFIISCFFIPSIIEPAVLSLAKAMELVSADAQSISEGVLLIENEFLRNNTYLAELVLSLIYSLIIPFVTILFFWISGMISGLIYFFVHIFYLRKKWQKETKTSFKVYGLVLGIVFALFSGMITIYPVAKISSVIKTTGGESFKEFLYEEFGEGAEVVFDAYEGTPVQIIYRFTGTEWVAGKLHSTVVRTVVPEKGQNIWEEFENIIQFTETLFEFSDVMEQIENSGFDVNLVSQIKQLVEDYFALNLIDDEKKVELLRNAKDLIVAESEEMKILEFLVIQDKEQLLKDMEVYISVIDFLIEEGINEDSFIVTKELCVTMIDKCYDVSNANIVIPTFINWMGTKVVSEEIKEIVQVENFVVNEQTKEDISEIFDVMYWLSEIDLDSLSETQMKEVFDTIEKLEDNETVGKQNYETILNYIKNKL